MNSIGNFSLWVYYKVVWRVILEWSANVPLRKQSGCQETILGKGCVNPGKGYLIPTRGHTDACGDGWRGHLQRHRQAWWDYEESGWAMSMVISPDVVSRTQGDHISRAGALTRRKSPILNVPGGKGRWEQASGFCYCPSLSLPGSSYWQGPARNRVVLHNNHSLKKAPWRWDTSSDFLDCEVS